MARPPPTQQRRPKKTKTGFQKGHKIAIGNQHTKGRPQYDREERFVLEVDKDLVRRYFNINSHKTANQLKKILQEGKISVLEGMLVRMLVKGYETGDYLTINAILDRLVGRVPLDVTVTKTNKFAQMSDRELLEFKTRLEETNRRTLTYVEAHYTKVEEEARQLVNTPSEPEPTSEANAETTESGS